jgi:hypothetical protein
VIQDLLVRRQFSLISEIQPEMLISIEGHSVADFDTQSAFSKWRTKTFKASWIQIYTVTA